MQLHHIKSSRKKISRKRVGRGGKRGTFSGRGSKGQKSRSGTRIRPGFRGGDNPIWKLFPKQRGSSKKTEIKRALFQVRHAKIRTMNLDDLERKYKDGDIVQGKVKILGRGKLTKKLTFGPEVIFSKSAHDKVQ